jgi:cell division protein FtsW
MQFTMVAFLVKVWLWVILKVGFLSEVHTDFVLAGITEEIGLFGLMALTSIMFMIIWRIFKISRRVENPIYHLFTLGIALMIIIAFLINSYGISGMIPIKGIAVPFCLMVDLHLFLWLFP